MRRVMSSRAHLKECHMGQTTAEAQGSLQQARKALRKRGESHRVGSQRGAVAVKDRDRNLFLSLTLPALARGTDIHIEMSLFDMLHEAHGQDWNKIPNNATIVFYNPWSPCQECTTKSIPEIIAP